MKRIPTLDGWRGIAILLVLVSHTAIALRGVAHLPHDESIGQHGVTLFFVLSGYLITTLLLQEQPRAELSLRKFYIRRLFRLMPCAWLYLLVIAILHFENHGWPVTSKELFASIFFYRNFVDVFGLHPVTGHFWSLSIEEQFYLVWPSILWLAGANRARWISVAGVAAIVFHRMFVWDQVSSLPLQSTFATQYRADALLVGCSAALWLPVLKPRLKGWMAYPFLIAFAACVAYYEHMILLDETLIIASLLLVTSSFPESTLSAYLEWKPLSALGKYSYSIYVWQQLYLLTTHTWADAFLNLFPLAAIVLASYYIVERPIRTYGAALADGRKSLKLNISSAPIANSVR